jgi:hypothetical protein
MFRTVVTLFNPDVMPSTAAHGSPLATPLVSNGPRLRWMTRDGRLMSRWRLEPCDRADEGARITGCSAA